MVRLPVIDELDNNRRVQRPRADGGMTRHASSTRFRERVKGKVEDWKRKMGSGRGSEREEGRRERERERVGRGHG